MDEPIASGSAILAPHPLVRIHVGSAVAVLRTLPECYFHEIVTSPPFYGVRDYKVKGAIGMEKTLDEYLNRLVEVFSSARRVLRDDGVMWVEMGDALVSAGKQVNPKSTRMPVGNLVGLPWEVAKAIRDSGWILRAEIIVEKNNPLPEAAPDRVSRSHSTMFMFSKARKYFYDRYAVLSPASANTHSRGKGAHPKMAAAGTGRRDNESFKAATAGHTAEVFARSVWHMNVDPYKGEHSSTFPVELPRRCMKLGTSARGCCTLCGSPFARHTEHVNTDGVIRYETMGWVPTCPCSQHHGQVLPCRVLDLFGGSGSTALAGIELAREVTLIEINPESAKEAVERIEKAMVPGKPKRSRKRPDPPTSAPPPAVETSLPLQPSLFGAAP